MSLTTIPERKFRIGIIMSKSFDDSDWLPNKLAAHADQILTVSTNGVNSLVAEFCQAHGIVYTVYPVSRNTLWSNGRIVENSDKIYILGTPESHNSILAKQECEKQNKKFEVVEREQIAVWKEKVCKAQEVLAAIPEEDLVAQPALKALKGVLG